MEIVIMEFLEITKELKILIKKEIAKNIAVLHDYDTDMTDISVINEEVKRLRQMLEYNEWGCMFDYLHFNHYMDRLNKDDKQYENDCHGYEPRQWVS